MAQTTTVRVHQGTREAIARLSKRRGTSAAEILDELVTRAEEDELLAAMNEAYDRLRSDPGAWKAERAERAAWDATLLDALAEL